jgi:PAS domain S-box-containing protein
MFDLAPVKRNKKNNPAPLLCWDIYSGFLNKLYQHLEDKTYLENFLQKKTIVQKRDLLDSLKNYDALILTDINSKILWASSGFHSMTGYTVAESIGKSPVFLQGEKTDKKTLEWLNDNLVQFKSVTADLVNYRKNGTAYICKIHIEPVFNYEQQAVNFLAFEKVIA